MPIARWAWRSRRAAHSSGVKRTIGASVVSRRALLRLDATAFDVERALARAAGLAAVVVRFFVVAMGSGYTAQFRPGHLPRNPTQQKPAGSPKQMQQAHRQV